MEEKEAKEDQGVRDACQVCRVPDKLPCLGRGRLPSLPGTGYMALLWLGLSGFGSLVLADHLPTDAYDLPTVDEGGKEEVEAGLQPEEAVLTGDVEEAGAATLDQHKAADGGRGGEELGQGAPVEGEGVGGPRDAGEEEQDDGHEDEEHHAGLAGAHEAGEDHGEEDAGQAVGKEEK